LYHFFERTHIGFPFTQLVRVVMIDKKGGKFDPECCFEFIMKMFNVNGVGIAEEVNIVFFSQFPEGLDPVFRDVINDGAPGIVNSCIGYAGIV